MGFCTGFARLLLITFNIIFWLSGVVILGVGIWILVDPDLQDYLDVIKDASGGEDFLKIAAYILIGFGAFVFLVGFCGCCGAIRRSKCLLGLYIFFLVVVCAGELAVGIYVAVYSGEAEDKMETGLKESIQDNYGKSLTGPWDLVQKELKCCGGLNYSDYENSDWQKKQSDDIKIPVSCCKLNANGQIINETKCQMAMDGDYFYKDKGCKGALNDWINDHSIIMIGVGCGIAALELLGLVCAICFCRHMDRDKYSSN
ncbi:CD82 antigen [Aplysia californica]|uniref:Tetraspanin n=1 Tax=Aplysia californica TaxID=6500 RepID=A0ABM0JHA0_APLCA|nr:CD82 antigen [Aplysia californica]XP_005093635.1 CD82 antigen [Aplysia californica]